MASVINDNPVSNVYIKSEIDLPDDCEYEDGVGILPGSCKEEVDVNEDMLVKEELDSSDGFLIDDNIVEANSDNGAINFHSVYIRQEINSPDFEPEVKLESSSETVIINESNQTVSAKKVIFKCGQCLKTFKRRNSLMKHMEVHVGLNFYRCQECNKYFSEVELLLKHVRNIHKNEKAYLESAMKKKPFQRYFCEKAFDLGSPLLKHEELQKGEEPFRCSKCQLSFRLKVDLCHHMKENHVGKISYKCDDCPETFVKKMDLLRHRCEHKREDLSDKDNSGADTIGFAQKKPTNQHPKKDFKCSKCGEVFVTKYQLQEHLEVHAGIRPFQCVECKKAFKRKVDLKNHSSTYHSNKNKKKIACKCHLCGSNFSYSSSLSRHRTKGRCQFSNLI